jgi:hypothetical protein
MRNAAWWQRLHCWAIGLWAFEISPDGVPVGVGVGLARGIEERRHRPHQEDREDQHRQRPGQTPAAEPWPAQHQPAAPEQPLQVVAHRADQFDRHRRAVAGRRVHQRHVVGPDPDDVAGLQDRGPHDPTVHRHVGAGDALDIDAVGARLDRGVVQRHARIGQVGLVVGAAPEARAVARDLLVAMDDAAAFLARDEADEDGHVGPAYQ